MADRHLTYIRGALSTVILAAIGISEAYEHLLPEGATHRIDRAIGEMREAVELLKTVDMARRMNDE